MQTNNLQNSVKIKSNEVPEIDFYNAYKDLPNEKWEELLFADKLYEISNYGRLKSYATNKNGIILKNKNTGLYLTVDIMVSKKQKGFCIHKLVGEYFVPNDDKSKNKITHIDYNKKNNYYENLKWVNSKECFEHNEKFNLKLHEGFRKNKTSAAKITKQDADLIRNMIKDGVLQSVIAKKFKISEMQITRIKRNENWIVNEKKIKKVRKKNRFVKVFSTQ